VPSGEQIEIVAGDQQAVVVEVGGGLRSYSAGGRELVDGYGADERSSSGRGQALIPWPNRLQDGSYEFDGRRHQLPLNEPEHRNAIHGLVRWAAWTASRARAALGRDGTRPLSATGLPLLAHAQHRICASVVDRLGGAEAHCFIESV
jgi:galactose mutarotase-like enzyme